MIDSHAHLQSDAFASDLPEVLERAREAGIDAVLVPGWDLPSSRAAAEFAGARQGVTLLAAAGIHPHAAANADDETWSEVEALAGGEVVAAIGETGLDYDRLRSPRDAQLSNLRRHLELAGRLAKPLVLHCRSAPGRRDAQDDLLAELERAGAGSRGWSDAFAGRPAGVLHSFSGPVDYGARALDLGLAVSFSGLVFRAGQESSGEVARLVPADRLLVETDAPFLPPRGAPRRRNEPAFVGLTAAWLAEVRRSEVASLGRDLAENLRRTFGPFRPA